MPTLDDTTTLQKNVAIAANDAVCISNKDSSASSQIQQAPAALAVEGFSHAWLINYDNSTLAAADNASAINFDLFTFGANHRLNKARLVVPVAFAGSGLSDATVVVGVEDDNADGLIESISVNAITAAESTGDLVDTKLEGANNPTDADTLRLTFDPAGCNNDDLTAGQLVLLVNIIDISDYKDLVPAT